MHRPDVWKGCVPMRAGTIQAQQKQICSGCRASPSARAPWYWSPACKCLLQLQGLALCSLHRMRADCWALALQETSLLLLRKPPGATCWHEGPRLGFRPVL